MDEKAEKRRDADARATTAENTVENRVAFAAVFAESFAADSAALLSYAGFVRATRRATLLHVAASELCAAVGVRATLCSRQIQSDSGVDDSVREAVLSCAREKAHACAALMFEAEIAAGSNAKVAACARNAGKYARLLLFALTHSENDNRARNN